MVDAGGFSPELDNQKDLAWFQMDAMKLVGTDAVGIGDRDLRFGLAFVRETAKSKKLDLVCANLFDKKTKLNSLKPYVIKKFGGVNVGIFGLMSDKVDLGPSRDSLLAQDPMVAAKRVIPEMKKKGATVIVLLSQLGKVESEDLATAVDGIDAVITGRNVPMLQKGRLIKNSVVIYGGEQGQYIGRTVLALDAQKKVTSGDAETFILGPEVGEKPEVAQIVKAFDDSFNEKMRKLNEEQAKKDKEKLAASAASQSPDHFIGGELCARCHESQAAQWKTTKHAKAWATLVENKKDATPECIPCHVVGYKQPGGFTTGTDTPALVNVQCENCHGMGTKHEAFAANPQPIPESTCLKCHISERDPEWNFEKRRPNIVH